MTPDPPVLLVLRALGLGDLLTAAPALRGLRRAFPEHRLQLAAPRGLVPALELITGADGKATVDGILDVRGLDALPSEVGRVAVAANLHGRGPQSHRLLLELRPERLLAFAHPDVQESHAGAHWLAGEHEVHRWCRMLAHGGVACDPRALDIGRPTLRETRMPAAACGATVLHPGAASGARRWPADRWAALARAELAGGRRVLVTGGATEVDLAERIATGSGLRSDAVLAGRTGLRALAALVGAAGRVVCGDTGVGHLATALRTPSVLLFGPVGPQEWGPPPERPWHRVLWNGRHGDPHGETPDSGLLQIRVRDVLRALELLDREGAAAAPVPV
ncbi:MAG: glycosyl transferase, family 9 [Solirubrobacterales bacterium]|nr:glycosyl transferase, family 9 [Solirubrobacterales bacterium]